ncbi:MAG: helix-turn-helix transcriptional regulator [Gemmataceae bacterium]|nr:helix-turn-helix transcriptional regulator [Gemmataceae bacterium]
MKYNPKTKRMERTPEEKAAHNAIHERSRSKPTIEELRASGELSGESVPMGVYLAIQELLFAIRQEREKAGITLTDVARKAGVDNATVSRLENGKQPNPTMATLLRYALATGKEIRWQLVDAEK